MRKRISIRAYGDLVAAMQEIADIEGRSLSREFERAAINHVFEYEQENGSLENSLKSDGVVKCQTTASG